jgi:hypothetical protein
MPGTRNSLGMNHEALDIAANVPVISENPPMHDLHAVYLGESFITFALAEGEDSYRLLKPLAFGRLMKSLIGANSISSEDIGDSFISSSADLVIKNFLLNLANIPQHSFSKTGFAGMIAANDEVGNVRFEYLGKFGALK